MSSLHLYMLERVKGSSQHAGADDRLAGARCGAVNERTGCLSFIPRPVPVCGRPVLGRTFPALRDMQIHLKEDEVGFLLIVICPLVTL